MYSLLNQQEAKAFMVRIQELSSGVRFSFDGSIDLTGSTQDIGLTIRNYFMAGGSGAMDDSNRGISISGNNGNTGTNTFSYVFNSGIPVPVFGTTNTIYGADPNYGGYTITGSGDPFMLRSDRLSLPQSFNSGDTITGEMTFVGETLANLNLTTGSVTYQLGNNTMEIYTTPAPLPILGLPVVFSYFKKLKEKSRLHRGA